MDELSNRLKEEIDLLYFLEKDMADVKEKVNDIVKFKDEIVGVKVKMEEEKKKVDKIRKISLSVIAVCIVLFAIFSITSCDFLFPSFDGGEDTGKLIDVELINTSWIIDDPQLSEYVVLDIESGEKISVTLSDRSQAEGAIVSDTIIIDDDVFTFSKIGDKLILLDKNGVEISYSKKA